MSARTIDSFETIVSWGRYYSYHPAVACHLGIKEAILLELFIHLSSIAGQNGTEWVYKNSAEIFQETGIHKDAQQRVRAKLVKLGILEEDRKPLEHTIYFRVLREGLNNLTLELAQRRDSLRTLGAKHSDPPEQIPAPYFHKRLSEETSEETTPMLGAKSAPRGRVVQGSRPSKQDQLQGLGEFWAEYPNHKGGTKAAERAWISGKCWAKADVILRAVREQKTWPQWQKDGGQYVPLAQTWLHQERWTAEQVRLRPALAPRRAEPATIADEEWTQRYRALMKEGKDA